MGPIKRRSLSCMCVRRLHRYARRRAWCIHANTYAGPGLSNLSTNFPPSWAGASSLFASQTWFTRFCTNASRLGLQNSSINFPPSWARPFPLFASWVWFMFLFVCVYVYMYICMYRSIEVVSWTLFFKKTTTTTHIYKIKHKPNQRGKE